MAGGTSPPHGATRFIETTRGVLTADFNGRVTRLWLRELLCDLDLPDVELVPVDPTAIAEYLQALPAGDQMQWSPLALVWDRRLEGEFQGPSAR